MKITSFALTIALGALAPLAVLAGAQQQQQQQLVSEAKGIIQQFATSLKGELVSAMQTGGPVKAIEVCHVEAPELAHAASTDGWSVARSSLKLRNPANAPDAFTAAAMEDFMAEIADGADVKTLARAAIVEENGQQVFRLVKAIPTGEVCLKCHGSNIAPEVEAQLDALYPDDQARGFQLGDMRGVFTLSKVLTD